MSLPCLTSSAMTSSGMCNALQIRYNIFSPQDTIWAWKNVSELHLWQITSLDRSMKEHKILRQPPSEWTCLWALNDVSASDCLPAVSLAVPITWFISQVSWSNAGLGKGGRWRGADIYRIGPVCWTLGCWSSCYRRRKIYHTSFQIITGAFQHYAVYMYMFVFAIQDNLLFRWLVLWHHSTLVLFTKLPCSYTVIKLNHISRKPLTKPNNSDVQLFEVESLPSMDIVSSWNYGTCSHDLVQWGAFLTRRHTLHTLSKDSKDDTVHACHWCLNYI